MPLLQRLEHGIMLSHLFARLNVKAAVSSHARDEQLLHITAEGGKHFLLQALGTLHHLTANAAG
jgi:hypothetical protein